MQREHVIADSLFDEACRELKRGHHWVAYNSLRYFLDRGDVYFFHNEEAARLFTMDNISDDDCFYVIHADTITSLLRQLPYGASIDDTITETELITLFNSFDWNETMYDPLHDAIEVTTEQEKLELDKMERLLAHWENLYERYPLTLYALPAH